MVVDWLAAGRFAPSSSESPPETVTDIANLVPLSHFAYTCWQLGDRAQLLPDLRHDDGALCDMHIVSPEPRCNPPTSPAALSQQQPTQPTR